MALDEREKLAVSRMRAGGLGYKAIATRVVVSRDQVRSYLTRAGIEPESLSAPDRRWCRWCGAQLPQRADGKKPSFCSSEHRRAFWRTHPEAGARKAFYEFTCAHCGTPFKAYGNAGRKYCSHACYNRHRFNTKGGRS